MIEVRPARPDEAAELSALALRSKMHWGYPDEWVELYRPDLSLTPDEIAAGRVLAADVDGRLAGFATVEGDPPEGEIAHLWVDPPAIGTGVGRRLFARALDTARAAGLRSLVIHSDPHAEGFYLAMGAVRIGDVASTSIPGRTIPLLRVALS